MPDMITYGQALKAAEGLSDLSTEALYEQMGMRVQDSIQPGGHERAQLFDADFSRYGEGMLSASDLHEIGRGWSHKLEQQFLQYLCADNDAETKMVLKGKTAAEIAAALATTAGVPRHAPPSWLIVAATRIAITIAEGGIEPLCESWRQSLAEAAAAAEGEAYKTAESEPEVPHPDEG